MQILLGTVTTGPALAVVPYAYEERVFTLTPSGSGDDVIEGNDNVFQVCFTDSNQGTRSAQYIDEHFEDPQIAVIYRNDDAYSQGIRDNFVAEAENRGMSSSMRAPSPRPARPTSTTSSPAPSPPG